MPHWDVNVCWARLGAGDKAGHFHDGTEAPRLCPLENGVPYPVMPVCLCTLIGQAVQGVVAKRIADLTAGGGGAFAAAVEDGEAKPVEQCHPELLRMEMKAKGGAGDDVQPVACMRKREGVE